MLDAGIFRRFVPTNQLGASERTTLARHSVLRSYQRGEQLFRAGGVSPHVLFLTQGRVEIDTPSGAVLVEAGTDRARFSLSSGPRHAASAQALSEVELLFVDREQLDRALTWTQAGEIEVRDMQEDSATDWLSVMLRASPLQQVPPANIVRVIAAVEQVQFAAGETIIRQGAPGDDYYVLVEGECRITRKRSEGQAAEQIDRIGPGRGFGEEALISGLGRNASVEALTDCRLMRLCGREFQRFLREPLVQTATMDDLESDVQRVDARTPEEFAHGHLKGAINLPLRDIRASCLAMDPGRPAVVYCDGGGRSAAATFLLRERGFNARWLEGGVPSALLVERG
ncbi:cyclic nucleotide-binding domain-containing protein [Pseudomarimonas arenosa]|uniref:Cyclic nucleotide-binding domain-containing protein n=1 Tax=Pseudomarimonas arenosa TaxID=2774145 RepID=A0AAW3ZT76_9GAMM|nr:cyclic nucleotide-binding domain-containing protein [Pseudomarimonas arenosa]MBD8528040.1 cyclic nucleotide-binding domain-containing protein [Pseudomarimonas arenosa]